MRKTFSSPFAVEREGDAFARAGSVCPVCQPLFVLPPSFDSDLVELLIHTGVITMTKHYLALLFSLKPVWAIPSPLA